MCSVQNDFSVTTLALGETCLIYIIKIWIQLSSFLLILEKDSPNHRDLLQTLNKGGGGFSGFCDRVTLGIRHRKGAKHICKHKMVEKLESIKAIEVILTNYADLIHKFIHKDRSLTKIKWVANGKGVLSLKGS